MPIRYLASICLLFAVLFTSMLTAQDYLIGTDGQVSTCAGRFLDSGGADGNHAATEAGRVTTICPTDGEASMRVLFSTIDISGTITVFNGSNTSAREIGSITPILNGRAVIFRATAANTSGCLTFEFVPDGTNDPGQGWIGQISCVTTCQPIEAVLLSSDPEPVPNTQQGYIDICPGDPITLRGMGVYPENGTAYNQSDATSTFTWNFQNGDELTGQNVTYTYDEPGGYVVQLTIEDRQNCRNGNRISRRVRVAPPPEFAFNETLPQQICPGEEVVVDIRDATQPGGNFSVTPTTFPFATSQARAETVFLPDGDETSYRSPLVFTNFDPGQVLADVSDIVQICAIMEHSWLGDLEIQLECPGGRIVTLHEFRMTGDVVRGQVLGQADRETITPDPPGTYCWTTTAPRSLRDVVRSQGLDVGDMLPEQDYRPDQSFDDLIGCELNGEWTIVVTDRRGQDEGYIFEWSIDFASDVYPEQEEFTVPIDNVTIRPNSYYGSFAPDLAVIDGNEPGPRRVVIESEDDFGCVYDTTFYVEILSPFAEECYTCPTYAPRSVIDTGVCSGDSFIPNVGVVGGQDTTVTYRAVESAAIRSAVADDFETAYTSAINVRAHNPGQFTTASDQITEICIDLNNSARLSDLNFVLVSPSGDQVPILSNFAGSGGVLSRTCFSTDATADIADAAPPYNGTFRLSQPLDALNRTAINGEWVMRVWDEAGTDRSEFISWSIGLAYDYGLTFSWSGAGNEFSCTDCADPTITPSGPGQVELTITDAAGCEETVTVNISESSLSVNPAEVITTPSCNGSTDGRITVTIPETDSLTYLWSTGQTGLDLTGIGAGEYSLEVATQEGCSAIFTYSVDEPAVVAAEALITDVSCNGGSDGAVDFTVTGGTPPYTFLWSDPSGTTTEDIDNLPAGTYTVAIRDANDCGFDEEINITEPAPLTATTGTTPVICRGESTGTATVSATGGTPDYTYAWPDGQTEATATGLAAGNFTVTVTDDLGCTVTAVVEVIQPDVALSAAIDLGEPGCSGASENVATAVPTGGAGDYTFAWSNGETTATAVNLPAGEATVTLSDANGCSVTATVEVVSLPPVELTITPVLPTCNGGTDGQLRAIASGGRGVEQTDYQFRWGGGQTTADIDGLTGEREYTLVVTGPAGCTGTQTTTLATPDPITIEPSITAAACFGDSTGSIELTTITSPNPGEFAILWGPEAGGVTTRTVSGLPAGNYPVTITDAVGCTLFTSVDVTQPDSLIQQIEQTNISCFGEIDGVLAVTGSGGTEPYRFTWSDGATTSRVTGLAPGDYSLTLTDVNGCTAIDTYEILEPGLLVANPIITEISCEGGRNGRIFVDAQGGTAPFEYRLTGRGGSFDPAFLGLGLGTYDIDLRDANGCEADTVASLLDGPAFTVDLGPDIDIVFGDSVTLMPDVTGGRDTLRYDYRPSAPTAISCFDCPNPVIQPAFELDYTLVLTDAGGCVAEDRIRISVRKIREVAIPTGFSPNGNNSNDRLLVHGRPGTRVLAFQVFDRWANLLFEDGNFEVNDPTRGWDGTHEDEPVAAGVYLYKVVVQYEDITTETLSGQTTLIR